MMEEIFLLNRDAVKGQVSATCALVAIFERTHMVLVSDIVPIPIAL